MRNNTVVAAGVGRYVIEFECLCVLPECERASFVDKFEVVVG
jgi:hypothetical protein